jgi:hypothetical protein
MIDAATTIEAVADAPIDRPSDAHAVVVMDEPDASHKTVPRPRPDAGAKTIARDAALANELPKDAAGVAPAGFGKLTAKHKPDGSYLNVLVDGKLFGTTPLFGKQIASGAHVIELLEPDTNKVVVKKQVVVDVGGAVKIEPP